MSPSQRCRTLAALLALLPVAALAQFTETTQAANVRAGPDRAFPLVTWLPARTTVNVAGCTTGREWCDIVIGRRRGWIHAQYLPIAQRERAPVVTFAVEAYWNAHYSRRPWFADKAAWAGWGTPSFQPPPPR